MTCTTTHYSCDCQKERMAKLERLLETVKIYQEYIGSMEWCTTKDGEYTSVPRKQFRELMLGASTLLDESIRKLER